MKAAMVDMDKTLVEGTSYSHLIRYLWENGWRRGRLAATLAARLPYHYLRGPSLQARLKNQRLWAEAVARLLKGASVCEVRSLFDDFARVVPLRAAMVDEIESKKADNFLIIIISTSIQPLVSAVGDAVGADHCIGTAVETTGGCFTGRLAGPPCNHERKLTYLQHLLKRCSLRIKWQASYAYSDGYPDLPMLKKVGNPVVVSPDEKLALEAKERGWRRLDRP